MTNKQGIGLGLLCGIALGTMACVGVLVWSGSQLKESQKAAYEAGIKAANSAAGNQDAISVKLNDGLMQENLRFANQMTAAREALQPLAARTDLPADTREAVDKALKALE
ncbi:MAG: hypothetical protein IT464_06940 [Planctomycetes bacterium]|nr:hypothetical protein [Planctomycetota bacterium]